MHRMNLSKNGSRCAMVVTLMAVLAGCATDESAGGVSLAGVLARIKAGPQAASAPQAGGVSAAAPAAAVNPIRATELDNIFKKNPITNSKKPEIWPRVAVTIKSATPGVHNLSGPGTLTPNDCIVVDIRLWKSASDNKKFENLSVCTPTVSKEAEGVAFRTLDLFPRFTFQPGQNTTAAQRTDGPTPPFHMFPQDIKSTQEWILMSKNTKFFLGTVLLSLGYDWDNDFDRRVWFVSVPQPGAK